MYTLVARLDAITTAQTCKLHAQGYTYMLLWKQLDFIGKNKQQKDEGERGISQEGLQTLVLEISKTRPGQSKCREGRCWLQDSLNKDRIHDK